MVWNDYCQFIRDEKETSDNSENHKHTSNCSRKVGDVPFFVVSPNEKDQTTTSKNQAITTKVAKLNTVDKLLNKIARDLLKTIIHPSALAKVENLLFSTLTVEGLMTSLASSTLELEEEERRKKEVRKAAIEVATAPTTLPVLPLDYPYLSKSIDVTDSFQVRCVLREVTRLQKAVCEVDNVFKFDGGNGKPTFLVRVPSSTNRAQFQKNLTRHGTTSWVDDVLDAMLVQPQNNIPSTDDDDEELFDDEHGPLVTWKKKAMQLKR